MSIETPYIRYVSYVNSLQNVSDFKNSSVFQDILEHVSYEQGIQYLEQINKKTDITENEILEYCKLNDEYGGGQKYNYINIQTSPSNLRYILHSYLILKHLQNLGYNRVKIVELGCGYGGLCLALNFFSKKFNIVFEEYNMIDLPQISRLQEMYLKNHNLSFSPSFYSAFQYGSNLPHNDYFLISNYCFSEISKDNQKQYIYNLFPKVNHGFLVWNCIPLYNFGFSIIDEEEYPLTGAMNKYVYF